MHHFTYRNNELWAEEVPVRDLAREFGTPLYVYPATTRPLIPPSAPWST